MAENTKQELIEALITRANSLFEKGNPIAAEKALWEAISLGSNQAKVTLGRAYLSGDSGLARDENKGLRLCKEAAESGLWIANYWLAFYSDEKDFAVTEQRWQQAIKHAQTEEEMHYSLGMLALFYNKNNEYTKMFPLLEVVAANGDPTMEWLLGSCYDLGKGTPVDLKLALYWYEKAVVDGFDDEFGTIQSLRDEINSMEEATE